MRPYNPLFRVPVPGTARMRVSQLRLKIELTSQRRDCLVLDLDRIDGVVNGFFRTSKASWDNVRIKMFDSNPKGKQR
jgi:hypothetical protein